MVLEFQDVIAHFRHLNPQTLIPIPWNSFIWPTRRFMKTALARMFAVFVAAVFIQYVGQVLDLDAVLVLGFG